MRSKVCIVTGSRAEYGQLYGLMKGVQQDGGLELQVVVTGMHLSPEFGLTYKFIEEDGFYISGKVEMLVSSDTPVGITKSIGLGVIAFADVLDRLKPDVLVLLGDRFEVLAVAQAAMVAKIPIVHIAGGDTTEGSIDEAIRHSISKMAHLHFVTNAVAAKRVRQLGENPAHIFVVGSAGIDQIKRLKLLNRKELEGSLDFEFREKNVLITFHPATLNLLSPGDQFVPLLDALDALGPDVGQLFTKPNADTDGRVLIQMVDEYVEAHPKNAKAYTSLGQQNYFSVIAQVDAVIGNSSSGLTEVPSFRKPTLNIGDRQKGRLQTASVINCEPEATAILQGIRQAFVMDCSRTENPYGDGETSARILATLKKFSDFKFLLKKHFFEIS